jgi:FkbM family methyltransferase
MSAAPSLVFRRSLSGSSPPSVLSALPCRGRERVGLRAEGRGSDQAGGTLSRSLVVTARHRGVAAALPPPRPIAPPVVARHPPADQSLVALPSFTYLRNPSLTRCPNQLKDGERPPKPICYEPSQRSEIMFGSGRVKKAVRGTIARHRRSAVIMAMHQAASFFESAWRNEGSDFSFDGEKFVLERLKPAEFRLAIDVGANMGAWFQAALELWPNCKVHAFEVAPHTYKLLEDANRSFATRARVELHGVGLSDQPGIQTLYYFPDHPDLTCDIPRHESYEAVPFQAQLTTLDTFCRTQKVEAIDFLKIDVEGAEHRVLKGASSLLGSRNISCIQFEYGAFSLQTRFLLSDYYEMLSDGFYIGKIFPNYISFGEYDWTTEDFRFCNYICVSKIRPDLRKLLQG